MKNNNFFQPVQQYNYIFKVIFIGSSCVGKTSLLTRFCDDVYTDSYQSTIGIDFRIKTFKINDKTIKIQIWDTAGQERYQSIASSHYKGTHGVICVFDLTNKESFEKVKENLTKCRSQTEIPDECCILLGNKCDLLRREVTRDEAELLSEEIHAKYFETSAKTGENVTNIFEVLCENIIEKKNFNIISDLHEKRGFLVRRSGESMTDDKCPC
jgi:Ras-related protein Rab-1A